MRQINFGTAKGVTDTVKQGQKAVWDALDSTFTIRNKWPRVGPYAIKIKTANKNATPISGEISTAADWLKPHEAGTDKKAQDGRLVVPTDQVRRNKRMIIPRGQRPKGLAGKAFVLETKKGPVLAQRLTKGKRKGLIVLYGLEKTVKIKKRSTFHEPIQKVVNSSLKDNIRKGIAYAFATAK